MMQGYSAPSSSSSSAPQMGSRLEGARPVDNWRDRKYEQPGGPRDPTEGASSSSSSSIPLTRPRPVGVRPVRDWREDRYDPMVRRENLPPYSHLTGYLPSFPPLFTSPARSYPGRERPVGEAEEGRNGSSRGPMIPPRYQLPQSFTSPARPHPGGERPVGELGEYGSPGNPIIRPRSSQPSSSFASPARSRPEGARPVGEAKEEKLSPLRSPTSYREDDGDKAALHRLIHALTTPAGERP